MDRDLTISRVIGRLEATDTYTRNHGADYSNERVEGGQGHRATGHRARYPRILTDV